MLKNWYINNLYISFPSDLNVLEADVTTIGLNASTTVDPDTDVAQPAAVFAGSMTLTNAKLINLSLQTSFTFKITTEELENTI